MVLLKRIPTVIDCIADLPIKVWALSSLDSILSLKFLWVGRVCWNLLGCILVHDSVTSPFGEIEIV